MSKKMRLKVEDLKIQSFVTTLQKDEKVTLKGGVIPIGESGTGCGSEIGCGSLNRFTCEEV